MPFGLRLLVRLPTNEMRDDDTCSDDKAFFKREAAPAALLTLFIIRLLGFDKLSLPIVSFSERRPF